MNLIETLNNSILSRYRCQYEYSDDMVPESLINPAGTRVGRGRIIGENVRNFILTKPDTEQITFEKFSKYNSAYNDFKPPRKQYHLVVIGYGGFMINLLDFMSRICADQMFKSIHIYEAEKLNTLNAVRIYKDLSKVFSNGGHKLDIIDKENLLSRGNITQHTSYFDENKLERHTEENTLFIGSPDFKTRKLLEGKNFLFFGHSGSETLIHKSPVVEDSMAVETYGTMLVSDFYKGVMAATHQFIWLLANIDIDELDNNTTIAKYNAVDNVSTLFGQDIKHRRKYSKEELLNDIQ